MRWAVVALVACTHAGSITPTRSPLPEHAELVLDGSSGARRRMVPPEAFLRAYLGWFGDLAPNEIFQRTHGSLFDRWVDYLAALGLPDYQVDAPRLAQSNAMMLATMGRLAEALCIRSAEHDLHKHAPADRRVVFAFEPKDEPSLDDFTTRFDVLHRTFLGYPVALAPTARAERFYALHRNVVARHAAEGTLTGEELAWAAVCTALVQHPEAGLY
ncbi:MAG: hypothetical protein ABI867_19030 [Kofleriaceae bacterium]